MDGYCIGDLITIKANNGQNEALKDKKLKNKITKSAQKLHKNSLLFVPKPIINVKFIEFNRINISWQVETNTNQKFLLYRKLLKNSKVEKKITIFDNNFQIEELNLIYSGFDYNYIDSVKKIEEYEVDNKSKIENINFTICYILISWNEQYRTEPIISKLLSLSSILSTTIEKQYSFTFTKVYNFIFIFFYKMFWRIIDIFLNAIIFISISCIAVERKKALETIKKYFNSSEQSVNEEISQINRTPSEDKRKKKVKKLWTKLRLGVKSGLLIRSPKKRQDRLRTCYICKKDKLRFKHICGKCNRIMCSKHTRVKAHSKVYDCDVLSKCRCTKC